MAKVLSVSEINNVIKSTLNLVPLLQRVQVRGEISNFKRYDSGHCYFTLKDEKSVLKAVMFKSRAGLLRFKPQNGQLVLASGRIEVYERDGVYQIYVDNLFADGQGDLMAAYEQLKAKLQTEGLFSLERKKGLPVFPQTLGVITSSSGAVLHDIITVSKKRNPAVKILFFPVRVQGREAAGEIVQAIKKFNQHNLADVLIVGRGGGSLEELWSFNEEIVARAVADSSIPVISAVGHETDVTLCDFAADVRAATPSQAAEIAVPDRAAQLKSLLSYRERLCYSMQAKLEKLAVKVDYLTNCRVLREPQFILAGKFEYLDQLSELLQKQLAGKLLLAQHKLSSLAGKLDTLSPLAILARGYSVTTAAGGEVLKDALALKEGDLIKTRLAKGVVLSRVEKIKKEGDSGFEEE